jgi:hypothetical protein
MDGSGKMEELILKIIENSLIGGAFLFLLYQFVTKFTKTQEDIVSGLTSVATTLLKVSETLNNLDERVKALEEKE